MLEPRTSKSAWETILFPSGTAGIAATVMPQHTALFMCHNAGINKPVLPVIKLQHKYCTHFTMTIDYAYCSISLSSLSCVSTWKKSKFIVKQPQIDLLGGIPEETVSMSVICLKDLPVEQNVDNSDADDHD